MVGRRVFRGRKNPIRRGRQGANRRRRFGGGKKKVTKSLIRSAQVSDTTMLKFRYAQTVAFNSGGTGAPGFYVLSGNSLFDPDVSGTGHQPMGFDQWTAFYAQYLVMGCKVKATYSITTGSTAPTQNCKFSLTPLASDVDSSVITGMTDISNVIETPGSKFRQGNIVGGGPSFTLQNYMPTHKVDGVNRMKVLIDDQYAGLMGGLGVGSSPTNNWRWILGIQPTDNSSTITGYVTFQLTYYAKLFDRKPLSLS